MAKVKVSVPGKESFVVETDDVQALKQALKKRYEDKPVQINVPPVKVESTVKVEPVDVRTKVDVSLPELNKVLSAITRSGEVSAEQIKQIGKFLDRDLIVNMPETGPIEYEIVRNQAGFIHKVISRPLED